jgi:hypothetical protein
MILHSPRERPAPWKHRKQVALSKWLIPFIAFEWIWEWAAFGLSNWSFLEVLEYLGSFSVLIAVIFYFSESGNRIKQRHYQAWQVINTAQGKGGSGGRIEALEELNADRVPLVGVDVSSAFLQQLDLHGAKLMRTDFSSADLRNSNLVRIWGRLTCGTRRWMAPNSFTPICTTPICRAAAWPEQTCRERLSIMPICAMRM